MRDYLKKKPTLTSLLDPDCLEFAISTIFTFSKASLVVELFIQSKGDATNVCIFNFFKSTAS